MPERCAYCSRVEGHSPRCSVTKFGVAEMRWDAPSVTRSKAYTQPMWAAERILELEAEVAEKLQAVTERDRALKALHDIQDEISNGVTANWEYIDKRFAEGLGA